MGDDRPEAVIQPLNEVPASIAKRLMSPPEPIVGKQLAKAQVNSSLVDVPSHL